MRTKVSKHFSKIAFRRPSIAILINHGESFFELFDLLWGEHGVCTARGFSPAL